MRQNTRKVGLSIGLSVIVITLLIPGSAVVQADDEWPNNCNKNTPLVETGTYSGSLSPDDRDALRIDLDKGDYASVHLFYTPPGVQAQTTGLQTTKAPAKVAPLRIQIDEGSGAFTSKSGGDLSAVPGATVYSVDNFYLQTNEIEFRAYSEQQSPICIVFETSEDTAAEWRVGLATNDVKPPEVGADAVEAQQELEQRVDRLENRILELEERVSTLEAQLNPVNNSTTATG